MSGSGAGQHDVTDSSSTLHDVTHTALNSPTSDDDIRGKVAKYHIIKKLYADMKHNCHRRAAELCETEDQLRMVTAEYRLLCGQLERAKTRAPPEDAILFADVEGFCDVALQPTEQQTSSAVSQSLIQLILDASAEHSRQHDLLLKYLQKEHSEKINKLSTEIQQLTTVVRSSELKCADLETNINSLKQELERHRSEATVSRHLECPAGGHLEEDMLVEAMDPAALRMKIVELKQRIQELVSHNYKWCSVCEALKREVDQLNAKLSQLQTRLTAVESERNAAVAEARVMRQESDAAHALCRQLSSEVQRLEQTITQLEQRRADDEHIQPTLSSSSSSTQPAAAAVSDQSNWSAVTSDELMAVRLQAAGYREDYELERQEHGRTKARMTSLQTQWQTVYNELRRRQSELEQANAERVKLSATVAKLRQLLLETQVDKARIDSCLEQCTTTCSMRPTAVATAVPPLSPGRTEATAQRHKYDVSRLEEDGFGRLRDVTLAF